MNLIHRITHCFRCRFSLLGLLALLSVATSSVLSAATVSDLHFTSINGDTEYSVSASNISGISGSLTIPATYNGKPVTEIANYGFGSYSYAVGLTSVTIPSSIETIGEYAFLNCRSLRTVDFAPDSQLTTIKSHAFYFCFFLYGITLPDSLTSLGDNAFKNCSALTSLDLSQTQLTSIENNTFYFCSQLTSVILPETLTAIKDSAFASCSSLNSINFPQNLISIERYAFNDTSVALVDLSNTAITAIGESAFAYCYSLYSISLPETLSSIGQTAFYKASRLSSVTLHGEAPSLGAAAFTNTGSDVGGFYLTIYDGYEDSYRNTWGTSYNYYLVAGPPDPPEPPVDPTSLLVKAVHDSTSHTFSIITYNEGADSSLIIEHAETLGDAWSILDSNNFVKSTNSDTGTITRMVELDLGSESGYYRLSNPSTP